MMKDSNADESKAIFDGLKNGPMTVSDAIRILSNPGLRNRSNNRVFINRVVHSQIGTADYQQNLVYV